MKRFKELTEGLSRKVPVYHEPDKLKESTWQSYRAEALTESMLDVPTSSPEAIAKKHGVSVDQIGSQLKRGIDVEREHTSNLSVAREIALDHLGENPEYYTKLDTAKLEEALTPREKLSGAERLAPKEDNQKRFEREKQEYVSKTKELERTARLAKKINAPKGLKEGSDLPFHKYTNDELDAAIKHHADSATELRRFDRKSHAAYQHIQHAHAAREILKSRKRNLRNYGMNEAYNVTFNESGTSGTGDHLSQFSHHWAQFKLHNNLSDTDRTHLTKRNYHEQEMNKHYKHLTIRQKNDLRLTESVSDVGYKVGDKVVAQIGPHKGTVHTVIHVHPTGHLNIKPDVHRGRNKYHLGAAKADPKDVTRHLEEARTNQHGVTGIRSDAERLMTQTPTEWWKERKRNTKRLPAPNTGINRKTIQEIFQAAKDKKNGKAPDKDSKVKPGDFDKEKDLKSKGDQDPKQAEVQAKPPQFGSKDQETPQDAPEQKPKSNIPKPEHRGSKLVVKGPGILDRFQADPIVTAVTSMTNTGNQGNSGSQGVR